MKKILIVTVAITLLSLIFISNCFTRYSKAEISPITNQAHFRWYKDDSAESPTPIAPEDWGWGGINSSGYKLRLRIGINVTQTTLSGWKFKLQYANSTAGPWKDVGAVGSTEIWRYFDGKGTDKQQIAKLNLTSSTVKEHFVESSPTAIMVDIPINGQGEWDFAIETNGVDELLNWYFRMVKDDGTPLSNYSKYPLATYSPPPPPPPPPPTYALTITSTTGGTTVPSPGTYYYQAGTVVSVTAYPDTANYYVFDHWELDSNNIGSANPVSITMNTNHNLRAVFIYSPPSVGGIVIPVDKFALLAPYIGLTSTIVVAAVVSVVYVKRVKRRKEKQ
jgi:hypothetical protein